MRIYLFLPLEEKNFHKILEDKIRDLFFNLFTLDKLNKRMEFEKSLNLGKTFINKFFTDIYNSFITENREFETKFNNLEEFIEDLINLNKIPFIKSDLQTYSEKIQEILSSSSEIHHKAFNTYNLLSDFFTKLNNHNNIN